MRISHHDDATGAIARRPNDHNPTTIELSKHFIARLGIIFSVIFELEMWCRKNGSGIFEIKASFPERPDAFGLIIGNLDLSHDRPLASHSHHHILQSMLPFWVGAGRSD
jgi:hypothetical protein